MSTPNMFMQRSKYVCGYPHLPVAMAFSLDVACVVPIIAALLIRGTAWTGPLLLAYRKK